MRKTVLICGIFMLVYTGSIAQQLASMREIREGAVHFINQLNTYISLSDKSIDTVYTYKDSLDRSLLYEVVFSNRQAVLISGSKACIPVLGYYEVKDGQGILSKRTPIPEGLQDLIDGYLEEIRYCMNNDTITLFHAAEWSKLLHDSTSNRSLTTVIVAPLLTSTWDQGYPYNYNIPGNNQFDHCPVGCVAVAMGQVMNYWKYPVWTPNKTKQTDWCYMPDNFNTYGIYFERERDAVSNFLHECGTMVNTTYCDSGKWKSPAPIEDVRDVLVNYYGYDSDADFQRRFWYNENTWIGRIKNNLNQGWPVIYCGNGIGNHAFVCDGYDSDGSNVWFHFNFGWDGFYDGYFSINSLNPSTYNFNNNQKAIFYIYPSGTQDYCNFTLPLETHYTLFYILNNNPLEPYANVPKTLTRLISVPDNMNYPTTWYTIPNGATAEYVAHEEIILQSGFYAAEGSDFYAHIVPCPSCSGRATQNMGSGSPLLLSGYSDMPSRQDSSETVITEPNARQKLKVWPNPVSGMLHIQLPDAEKEVARITVCDLLGRVVLQKENLPKPEIEVSSLPNGMYLLQLQLSDGTNLTAKFVKD